MTIRRRDLIKYSVTGLALSSVPSAYFLGLFSKQNDPMSPIQTIGEEDLLSGAFKNDNFSRAHEALWDLEGFIKKRGGIPAAQEKSRVVVIGGGLSGLITAYMLRTHSPTLLELNGQLGGNAKGEQFKDAVYPLGSTYFNRPDEKEAFAHFLKELDLFQQGRTEGDAHIFYNSKMYKDFWNGSTDPAAKSQFQKIYDELVKVRDSGVCDSLYERPLTNELKALDSISFETWLKKTLGQVHPHIQEYFQLYAWSSFLTPIEEISAVQMLSFVSAETAEIMALPAGNAAVTQALYEKTKGSCDLRANAAVINVKVVEDGVEICYDDPEKGLRTIKAEKCVFAAPKFIAKRIISGLSEKQTRAMAQISYRAYAVANFIFDRPLVAPAFGIYSLTGHRTPAPTTQNPPPRLFTDFCFASWVQDNKTENAVLSVYGGLAYDGGRAALFKPESFEKYKTHALTEVTPFIKALGLEPENVKGIRFARWGHAMPVSKVGLLKSGILEQAHQPISNKIYFANQDNWANPCIESAFAEAMWVSSQLFSST